MLTTINPLVNGRNLIINPCMRIWQRGTTFNSSSRFRTYDAFKGYCADRWHSNSWFEGDGTIQVSRQVLSSTDAPSQDNPEIQSFLRQTGKSNQEYDFITQPIEIGSHYPYQGRWMTLSFWLKVNTGNPNLLVCLRRFYNENNWADGGTDIAWKQTFQVSSTWTKYTFTFKIPNIVVSPYTEFNPCLRLEFFRRIESTTATSYGVTPFDNSAFTLDLTGVKLEFGQQATPINYDLIDDFFKCCRYFESSHSSYPVPGQPVGQQIDNDVIPNVVFTRYQSGNNFVYAAHSGNAIKRRYLAGPGFTGNLNSRFRVMGYTGSNVIQPDALNVPDTGSTVAVANYDINNRYGMQLSFAISYSSGFGHLWQDGEFWF